MARKAKRVPMTYYVDHYPNPTIMLAHTDGTLRWCIMKLHIGTILMSVTCRKNATWGDEVIERGKWAL